MASTNVSPLNDIDERFLQCHICLNRLNDPKIFPCLHHFCRECLNKVLKKVLSKPKEGEEEKQFECPVCREKHHIPDNGVDGLKTDFNTKNIIEFIELYDSVKHEPLRVCIHCNQKHKATGYCFKCNDFLCEKCHEHHLNNPVLKDHRSHVFSLNEAEAKNLTVEKLASLKEAPRCSKHPTKLSELCCSTCGNLPICVPCTFGAHRGHDLQEVSVLAETEREKLITQIEELRKNNQKVYETQKMLSSATEILSCTAETEKTKLQEELDNKEGEIKRRRLSNRRIIVSEREEVHKMLKEQLNERKVEFDEEVKVAQDKYDRVCKEDQRQADILLDGLQERDDAEEAELQKKMESISSKFKELFTSLRDEQQDQATRIAVLTVHFNDIVRKYESVTNMASSVLAAKDDWTDVQCIPDIYAAIDPLIKEVRKDIPKQIMLTNINARSFTCEVDITGIEGWQVTGITDGGMGVIVVTGTRSEKGSLISVNDMKGVQLRKDVFPSDRVIRRFCGVLPGVNVATACYPNEIGTYSVSDGRYNKTNVGHIVKRKHKRWYISCLAVDPDNYNIIVGCKDKMAIHRFDNNANYVSTLTLPYNRRHGPEDIAVHGRNLLVCEFSSGGAYAAAMKGPVCEQLYEFSRPSVSGSTCSHALAVCIDGNSHIYMLWSQPGKVMAQYTPDGRQLLTTRNVDNAATCITTVITDETEKLLLATYTGKLYTYGVSCSITS